MSKKDGAVWEFFEKKELDGRKNSICKVGNCGMTISGHGSSNTKRHLRRYHPAVAAYVHGADNSQGAKARSTLDVLSEEVLQLEALRRELMGSRSVFVTEDTIPFSRPSATNSPASRTALPEIADRSQRRREQVRQAVKRHREKEKALLERKRQLQREIDTERSYATQFGLRAFEVERQHSINSFVAIYLELHPKLSRCLERHYDYENVSWVCVDPLEVPFILSAWRNLPIWRMLETLKAGMEGDPSGALRRLYRITCVNLLDCYDEVVGRMEWDIFNRLLIDAFLRLNFSYTRYTTMGRALVETASLRTLEPHVDCRDDVIRDVFSYTMAANVSFNFYERCAATVPRLRRPLKENIHLLPREVVLTCRLTASYAEYSREWSFNDSTGGTYEKGRIFRARRPPETVKRYAIQKLILPYDHSATCAEDRLSFLDCVDAKFLQCMSFVRADNLIIQGFDTSQTFLPEHIDKAKLCALHAQYMRNMMFVITDIAQLAALLNNARELPRTLETLFIQFRPGTANCSTDSEELVDVLRQSVSAVSTATFRDKVIVTIGVLHLTEPASFVHHCLKVATMSTFTVSSLNGSVYYDAHFSVEVCRVVKLL